MNDEVKTEIIKYINTFDGTSDLHKPYHDFQLHWLKVFPINLIEDVLINFECVQYERVFGNGEYNELVLGDFIKSLKKIIKD